MCTARGQTAQPTHTYAEFVSCLLWGEAVPEKENASGSIMDDPRFVVGVADIPRYGEFGKTLSQDSADRKLSSANVRLGDPVETGDRGTSPQGPHMRSFKTK